MSNSTAGTGGAAPLKENPSLSNRGGESHSSAPSAPAAARVSLYIEAPDDAALLAWAIKHAEEHGYSVRPPHEKWETPKEFCARLRIHSETLRRNAEKENRPHVVIRRGEIRIIELLSNAHFDDFVLRHKYGRKPGGKTTCNK